MINKDHREFRKENIPVPRQTIERAPDVLEIGAGSGLHAIQFCKDHPNLKYLAVEHTRTRFQKLLSRKRNHPTLENLEISHANAISVVTHFILDGSLEKIFLLYPNPEKKMWHHKPVMTEIINKLKPDGTITFATNLEDYYLDAKETYPKKWNFIILEEGRYSYPARTHFEKKYLERGHPCFGITLKKTVN